MNLDNPSNKLIVKAVLVEEDVSTRCRHTHTCLYVLDMVKPFVQNLSWVDC